MGHKIIGTVELTPSEENLLREFSGTILNGTAQQAFDAFSVIFEREPEDEQEFGMFKALCQHFNNEGPGMVGLEGGLQ